MNQLINKSSLRPALHVRLFLQSLSLRLTTLRCHLCINKTVRMVMDLANADVIHEAALSTAVEANRREAVIAAQLLTPQRGIEVARLLWTHQQHLNLAKSMAARLLKAIVSADCPKAYRAWLLGLLPEMPPDTPKGIPYLFTSSYGLHHLVGVAHPMPTRFCQYALETGYTTILKCIVHDLAQVYGQSQARNFLEQLSGVSEARKVLMLSVICTGSIQSKAEQDLYLDYLRDLSQQSPAVFHDALHVLEHRKRLKLLAALSPSGSGAASPKDPSNT